MKGWLSQVEFGEIWSRTESAMVGQVLYNVVFMASLTTLLFNLNLFQCFVSAADVPNQNGSVVHA